MKLDFDWVQNLYCFKTCYVEKIKINKLGNYLLEFQSFLASFIQAAQYFIIAFLFLPQFDFLFVSWLATLLLGDEKNSDKFVVISYNIYFFYWLNSYCYISGWHIALFVGDMWIHCYSNWRILIYWKEPPLLFECSHTVNNNIIIFYYIVWVRFLVFEVPMKEILFSMLLGVADF